MDKVMLPGSALAPQPPPPQPADAEWVLLGGGELEARRPRPLCAACRRAAQPRVLCFQCYRAGVERERKLQAAGRLDTASAARFQSQLPFEPVNRPRLQMLKAERAAARGAAYRPGPALAALDARRRRAQIAARRALQRVAEGLAARPMTPDARAREMAAAIHAAELQLPESWIPFVVSR